MANVENRHHGFNNFKLYQMKRLLILLPESISLAEMMQVKGGVCDLTSTNEKDDDIVIRCEPGPAVSCIPGNAVGRNSNN